MVFYLFSDYNYLKMDTISSHRYLSHIQSACSVKSHYWRVLRLFGIDFAGNFSSWIQLQFLESTWTTLLVVLQIFTFPFLVSPLPIYFVSNMPCVTLIFHHSIEDHLIGHSKVINNWLRKVSSPWMTMTWGDKFVLSLLTKTFDPFPFLQFFLIISRVHTFLLKLKSSFAYWVIIKLTID